MLGTSYYLTLLSKGLCFINHIDRKTSCGEQWNNGWVGMGGEQSTCSQAASSQDREKESLEGKSKVSRLALALVWFS